MSSRALVLLGLGLAFLLSATSGRADGGATPPAYLKLVSHGELDWDPGWTVDEDLQARLDAALHRLGVDDMVLAHDLGIALVDLTDPSQPRLAEVNGTSMMYAASVPKLAALLAAYQAEEEGRLEIDEHMKETLDAMIRVSSNSAASEAIRAVGFDYIASLLWQSGLYDPELGGGLWLGKAYGGVDDRWHRDPVSGLSHGANPLALARMLTCLAREELVSPEASRAMKEHLGDPGIHHKFVKGLDDCPDARIHRKSGTWRDYHGDAALIERDDKTYVAVALCQSPRGSSLLTELIGELDACVEPRTEAEPEALAARLK